MAKSICQFCYRGTHVSLMLRNMEKRNGGSTCHILLQTLER